MEIIDTVYLIIKVYCEGYTIQTLITDTAPKASRMKGFTHGLKKSEHGHHNKGYTFELYRCLSN